MARILIIEDNVASLELLRYLLEAFGHTVLTAVCGQKGVEAVRRDRPDLILCDVRLPRMDGFEVARYLKSHPVFRTIPLVAVTAYAMVGDRDVMLKAGFDGYIPKPIIPETFVKQVEGFLRPGQPLEPMQRLRETEPGNALSPPPPARRINILRLEDSPAKGVYELVLEFISLCQYGLRDCQQDYPS